MRLKLPCTASILLFLLAGCSSEQSLKTASDSTSVAVVASPVPPPSTDSLLAQPLTGEILVSNDSLITLQLERARQHYLSAVRADEHGDSVRATQQFESSLQILNDLSYYPDIESNADFNDLSKSVVETYERYIRQRGTIDSTSSVFALIEKLNVLSEQADSTTVEPQRVISGLTIPLVINGLVEKHIQFFLNRGRIHMENWLERSGKYFPMMKRILREEGVPEEMVYLAMIESGLNPAARSWARAVGLWQFVKGTGALYGLQGNFWYDDRRDFEKATRAAARHLRDLYEDFEDWYLVMAAYNSGAGKVYRAMRRSGSSDYWQMRRYLPRETRSYVPAYISTALIAMNPKDYGFDVRPADSLAFDYVTVDDCVDLAVLAECANTDLETLRELNPGLIHRTTPPTTKGFQLRVPAGTDKELYYRRYAELPDSKKMAWITHTVGRGETVPRIARHYGISPEVLAQANNLRSYGRLKGGRRLMIPIAKENRILAGRIATNAVLRDEPEPRDIVRTQARSVRISPSGRSDQTKITYKIKRGDTLGQIAEWYGVRAADIRNWNNIPYGRMIVAGTELTLWVNKSDAEKLRAVDAMTPAQKAALAKRSEQQSTDDVSSDVVFRYTVKPGDTLEKIAREHGVTIQQIRRWNNLSSTRLTVGKRLALYPRVKQVASLAANNTTGQKPKNGGGSRQIIYVVRKGDTISRIAQAHDVRESELREWNSLQRTNKIYTGQEIVIHKDSH